MPLVTDCSGRNVRTAGGDDDDDDDDDDDVDVACAEPVMDRYGCTGKFGGHGVEVAPENDQRLSGDDPVDG
jgi:hypothetical protein